MISPEDMDLFQVTSSVKEAVDEIMRFYKNYHSMRYVKKELVIRLQKEISDDAVTALGKKFGDICVKGDFRKTGPLEGESEREHLNLPRIAFTFDRIHYGRLRQLINHINSL
jgi:hypothetical protein